MASSSSSFQIINTTPHAITDVVSGMTFPSDPNHQIRISETLVPRGFLGSIPLFSRTFGELYNLPLDTKPNQYYLVSLLVKQARPQRSDLLSPGELIRDEKGVIIGCKGFIL